MTKAGGASTLLLCAITLACARGPDPRLGMPSNATPGEIAEASRLLDLALDDWIAQTTRLQRISQRLRVAGAELCPKQQGPVLGLSFLDLADLSAPLSHVARRRYRERRALQVVDVFEGMPAARAGVRPGDALARVAGTRTRSRRGLSDAEIEGETVRIEVLRDGAKLSLELAALTGCRVHSVAVRSDAIQAQTDGEQIQVHSALLREYDDLELAIVVGHELAHAIEWSYAGGPRTEERADRLGLYLVARAGFEPGDDPAVFEKLVRDLNRLREHPSTHPTTHQRTRAFRETVDEIRGKRERGEPLIPDPA